MPITRVSAETVTAPLHTEFVTALRRTSNVETVVVTVTDDDGRTGRGEAPQTWRITGQSLAGATACLEGPIRDAVIGCDTADLNGCLDRVDDAVVGNSAAKAAMDVALHDLWARTRDLPLVEALGGSATSIATVVTLAAGDAEQLASAATQRIDEGFTALKVKVGVDPTGDLARLAAIRQAVGPHVGIRVDANQGWSPKEAVRIIRGMEDSALDIELVEQPTPAHDLDGLAHVTASVDTMILADESVHSVRDLTAVIANRAADSVNIKLAKCGGLRAAGTLLELARAHDVKTTVGSMMEGPIGVGAIAAIAAARGVDITADLDAAWWLADQGNGLRYADGALHLPDGPGLSAITFSTQTDLTRRAEDASGRPLRLWFGADQVTTLETQPPGGEHVTVEIGQNALVSVAAATLWTSPKAAETTDRLAVGTHSAIREWVAGMTREQRVDGLVDRAVSQILLGEEVSVTEIDGSWAKVTTPAQPSSLDKAGYPGWLPTRQLAPKVEGPPTVPHIVSATATAIRDEPDGEVLIPGVTLGTKLDVIDERSYRGWSRVALPGAQPHGWVLMRDLTVRPTEPQRAASGRVDAVNIASQLLDVPYVWGGLTAYGLDCSGLVYLTYRMLGVDLPRDAHDQADATHKVDTDEAQPGDLYFFARSGKRIHHIGIATKTAESGKLSMIHAAGNYGKVVSEEFTDERAETFVGAHRVFPN